MMNKRIVLIMMIVVMPMLSMAQHIDFFGISMDKTIDEFEKILLEKGATKDFCRNGGKDYTYMRLGGTKDSYYKINDANKDYSIMVSSTKYSKFVYSVSVFAIDNYGKDLFYKVIGRIMLENNYDVRKKGKNFIKFDNDLGGVDVSYSDGLFFMSYMDNENFNLSCAEESLLYDKKMCKRWQKKYNNPRFYDENPRFDNERNSK